MELQQERYIFYFAYGSNADPSRMKDRCDGFIKRERAKLKFQLNKLRKSCGTAAANIHPCTGSHVYGALYTCHADALTILDRYEGVKAGHYYRATVDTERDDGSLVEATTFMAHQDRCKEGLKVKGEYLGYCLAGKDLYLDDYVQFLESLKDRVI